MGVARAFVISRRRNVCVLTRFLRAIRHLIGLPISFGGRQGNSGACNRSVRVFNYLNGSQDHANSNASSRSNDSGCRFATIIRRSFCIFCAFFNYFAYALQTISNSWSFFSRLRLRKGKKFNRHLIVYITRGGYCVICAFFVRIVCNVTTTASRASCFGSDQIFYQRVR